MALPIIFITTAACGGSESPADLDVPAEPAGRTIDPTTVGNIVGTITLEGMPPEPENIRMNSDPVCADEASNTETEYYIVGDNGGLGNVFVYVKAGLEGLNFPAPTTAVTLNQDGCRYQPHVFGIRVDQTLEILNSDPTLHNIHATPASNQEFNMGQPIEGMRFERTFSTPEVMVPFKCDVHGWMNAYAGVLDHPYFAVTGPDGSFEISGLPPGEYIVEAWHEMLGTAESNTSVAESATAELAFTFETN